MKGKTKSLAEGVSESTAACMLAMVQGNILALTIGHLMIALAISVVAGAGKVWLPVSSLGYWRLWSHKL